MNSAMLMQSPHRDVLEATPDTDESKAKLLEELQSRGRAAVGAKSWMDAKLLYEKTLTLVTTMTVDSNRVAVLNSNLSLVQQSMGNFEDARKAAEAATKADPTYVKGWWRLGQALQSLHRSQEALEALTKAKFLEPSNKALIKEHAKVQEKVDEEAKLLKELEDNQEQPMLIDEATTTTTTTTTTATKSKQTTSTKNGPSAKSSSTSSSSSPTASSTTDKKLGKEEEEEDEKIFTKSEPVRGYKIVNGKKTSYFHNELSEEAKSLIGDIAPKKLETIPTLAPAPAAAAGASVWNQAGTWEEKDLTKWAKTTLQEHIETTQYILPTSSPAPGAEVIVTKVKTLDGHASCAVARGKKRYIYEFMVKLEWKLSSPDESSDLECTGSLAIPDIDGTIDLGDGYEIHEFAIDSVSDNSLRPLIERFVQRGGFHDALNASIDGWVERFKSEY